ncbi:MAG: hypothetical protein ACXWKC_12130 [Xanthobacteraceae bacterium]
MLIVFKYTNAVLQLVEGSDYAPLVAGAIPAGISFYTFHEAVFLLDCYNRKPETIGFLQASPADSPSGRVRSLFQSLVSYASFVVFFPQLVIGPISYLKEMAPQFTAKRFGKINRLDLEVGLTLLAIGLFKKLVIADNIATFVNPLFYSWQAGNSLSPLSAWVAALGARASISRTNCCGPSPRASANAALRWT